MKFLYDFFHEQISEGNLISKLEKNIELVGLVHVADVPGRHEPGTGEINYANIFRKLGQCTIPLTLRWNSSLPPISFYRFGCPRIRRKMPGRRSRTDGRES